MERAYDAIVVGSGVGGGIAARPLIAFAQWFPDDGAASAALTPMTVEPQPSSVERKR